MRGLWPACLQIGLLIGLLGTTGGCSFTPAVEQPPAVAELPPAFEADRQPDAAYPDSALTRLNWWTAFNDQTLNALVDTALTRNLDLKVAVARVEEIQNQYRIARSPLFPSVQATVDGNRQNIPSNTGAFSSIRGDGDGGDGAPGGFQFPDRFETVTYSASLGLSYELDFWGKNRNTARAALREFSATRADYQTALLGVISETIATYFEIEDLERQIALSSEIVRLLDDRVQLSEDRYQRGLINSFELYSIRQAYEIEQATLPVLESSLREARGRLGILIGAYPSQAEGMLAGAAAGELPFTPIPAGLPSTLLAERPDVVAAGQRFEAARLRIGAAQAARFPSFSLTASGGTQSADLANLVEVGTQGFSILTGAVVTPIFQGGRLKAEVEVARAQYDQLAATYEKTVLTAFKEVDAALVSLEKQTERYRFLQEAAANAELNTQVQVDRYQLGIGDYLAFVDARINELRTKTALESAMRSLVNARITVHRSLGGAWVDAEL